MGVKYGGVLLLLAAAACMFAIVEGNYNFTGITNITESWNHTNGGYYPYRHKNSTTVGPVSNRFIVGGPDNKWRFGYNYTEWAIKNGPFYLNDTLVFKYDPPNDTTFPHSVYLLQNYRSFEKCDMKGAKKIGDVNEGGGEGFEFVLKKWQPYFFACGERNGFHCKVGSMKFAFWPLIRSNFN